MKKIFLPLLLISAGMYAQVGINQETPKATLDVVGKPTETNHLDGIIAPRITGTQLRAKTYTTEQTGAFVYVTEADAAPAGQTINVTNSGYYYFDGSLWVKYGGGSSTPISTDFWGLTGNAGTTLGTNFLGTTDNTPLQFRVNNTHAGIISPFLSNTATPTGGNVALGHNAMPYAGKTLHTNASPSFRQNVAIGYNTLSADPTDTVVQNVAVGDRVMTALTKGGTNVAIGNKAMMNANNADSNIAIGVGALMSLNTANNAWGNIALGYRVAENMTAGGSNVFLKNFTAINGQGDNFQTGNNNIFIGKDSGNGVLNGNNNIAIGVETKLNDDSNQMNIGKTIRATDIGTNAVKTSIGNNIATPNSTLQVGGSLSLPIRKGSGQVLDTDYTIILTGDATLPDPVGRAGRVYVFVLDGAPYIVSGKIRDYGVDKQSYAVTRRATFQSDGEYWYLIGL